MAKKIILTIIDVLSTIVIICAVFLLVIVVFTKKGEAPNVFGYSAFRVLTGSMAPEYPVDALVIIKRVDPEEIQEGDVISFYSSEEEIAGMVNTHRVVSIENVDGTLTFHTKGDANLLEDEKPVPQDMVIGKVVGKTVLVGKIVRLAANPLIFIPFIVVPLFIMLAVNIIDTVNTTKKYAQEEIEKELAKVETAEKPDQSVPEKETTQEQIKENTEASGKDSESQA